jgi:oligosaccharide reducing-end xylanase
MTGSLINRIIWIILYSSVLLVLNCISKKTDSNSLKQLGAYYTGEYPNLFKYLLGKSDLEVQSKIDTAWQQLFHGDDKNERVYFPVEPDMAYIEDILHKDVRSEGMSYGMMIAVQLDKKEEFDRLWKWAKTYMQHKEGARQNYFAWQMKPSGEIMDPNSASDGEEYIVMSLFFASGRWGDGSGIFNYRAEAQAILNAMLNKMEESDNPRVITNMFNRTEKQVVFVPAGHVDGFTDPSYHLPHFYELWAMWADREKSFWSETAAASREFFKKTVHPATGLMPDYAKFDGSPIDFGGDGIHRDFRFDAWRTAMNIAVDYVWFQKDSWAVEQSNRYLSFFFSQGLDRYVNNYTLDGKPLSAERSTALVAMNAAACLASDYQNRPLFVQALWDESIPSGLYRYYDGLLYMLGMLNTSGQFRIYVPK